MISEKKLVTALGLEVVVPSQDGTLPIEESDVCRPGLQLTGFWDYFAYERPQLFGKVEMAYLSTLDADTLAARLKTFFSFALPCVIVCRGLSIPEAMLVCARERHIPVYRTQENTVRLEMAIINYLNTELAPRRTMHGVLVDVYGVGIIDVYTMYGVASIIREKSIDMEVHMELWQDGHSYDRLGLDNRTTTILGVSIPSLLLPIHPGRNIAIVLEVAARNLRLKQMGYSAAEELLRRQTGIKTRPYGFDENADYSDPDED